MEHLKLLAMFSKRLGDDAVVAKLIGAGSVEDVIKALTEEAEDAEEETEEEDIDLDDITIM